ncbi:uncharacterized protein EV422DRAFT_52500 [Fimicolochytrium jonesii]|uniref:uncharacterized protein n=1 Tax=Fimicolochytrium jonesii TaxID=1396493 RepID=UPI0022FDE722|nr:uncharacterized protein EV422DRAFT_52500 [Fimicolochytrium jonesii]KAI8821092.1 hypothetical protein EV422DRAFT_52500 [Fimicolochytrium jonesii]
MARWLLCFVLVVGSKAVSEQLSSDRVLQTISFSPSSQASSAHQCNQSSSSTTLCSHIGPSRTTRPSVACSAVKVVHLKIHLHSRDVFNTVFPTQPTVDVTISRNLPADITCPNSSLAVLCVDASSADLESREFVDALQDRVTRSTYKFAHVHLLIWLRERDPSPFLQLQILLLGTSGIQMHPVHSTAEVRDVVMKIAWLASQEAAGVVQGKITQMMEELPQVNITSQGAWLPLITLMSGTATRLKPHDCFVIQEGAQTFANIARASVAQLRDFSLDKGTAIAVRAFFEEETVI